MFSKLTSRFFKPFTQFIEGEEVLKIERRHIFIHFLRVMKVLIIFSIIGFFIYLGINSERSLIRLIGEDIYIYGGITFIILSFLTMVFWIWFIALDRKYDTLIITNKRIIQNDQHFIFGHDMEAVYIKDIVNMKSSRVGFFSMLLRFGHLFIETAATSEHFIIQYMPKPDQIIQIIHNQLQKIRASQFQHIHTEELKEITQELKSFPKEYTLNS